MKTSASAAGLAIALLVALCGTATAQTTPVAPPAHGATRSRGVTVLDATAPANAAAPTVAAPTAAPPPPRPIAHLNPAVAPHPLAPLKCERAYSAADLRFEDNRAFDEALSAKLSVPPHGVGVVVDTAPFAPDAPPYRLRAWLGAVQKGGGDVGRREVECTRGFNLMAMLREMFTPRPDPIYAPAKKFDVVMWVSRNSGKVNQVQFSPR